MEIKHDLYLGDCEEVLKEISDNSVDLIFTSPHMQIREKRHTEGFILMIMSNGFCQKLFRCLECLIQQEPLFLI